MVQVIADAAAGVVASMVTEGGLLPGGEGPLRPYKDNNAEREGGGGSSGDKADGTVTAGQASPLLRATTAGESRCCAVSAGAPSTNELKTLVIK